LAACAVPIRKRAKTAVRITTGAAAMALFKLSSLGVGRFLSPRCSRFVTCAGHLHRLALGRLYPGGGVGRKSRHRNNGRHDPLSRDEWAAIGGEPGFAPVQLVTRCPSCLDNELSPPSDPDPTSPIGRKLGFRRHYNCPTCGGYGVVPARVLDPYLLPRKG
jgi:hypothetical protein